MTHNGTASIRKWYGKTCPSSFKCFQEEFEMHVVIWNQKIPPLCKLYAVDVTAKSDGKDYQGLKPLQRYGTVKIVSIYY